jgi:hypothetical protein
LGVGAIGALIELGDVTAASCFKPGNVAVTIDF